MVEVCVCTFLDLDALIAQSDVMFAILSVPKLKCKL